MSVIYIVTLLFLVILLLPFLVAGYSYGKGEPVRLNIRSNNARDPRFFAKSFRSKMEAALQDYDGGGQITLSRENKLITPPFTEDSVDGITLLESPFTDTRPRLFLSEVYCRSSAVFYESSSIRSVCGLDSVSLGAHTEIVRWADGEKELICGQGCSLGISASSANFLRLGVQCRFLRLYAPVICIGLDTEPSFRAPHAEKKAMGVTRTSKIETQKALDTDVISTGKLMIEKNAVILGSVKANGDIHVCAGVCILGNLVSDGTIVMEENVFVGGNVFSQYSVYVGRACQIGRASQIKSLIAQDNIYLCESARIFGFVSCERGGETVCYDDYIRLSGECY